MADPVVKQQVNHLIRLGADQFTGGDVAAFLRLASDDSLSQLIEAQRAELEAGEPPKPTADQIEESALTGGYLDNYLSLRAHGLRPEQAYFAAWYNAHPQTRRPQTMIGLARFLGRSRANVYKWTEADWFKKLSLNAWREELYRENLAEVDRKTITEAKTLSGAPGVQARRLFYEIGLPAVGLAGPGDNEKPPDDRPKVNVYLPENGR